MFFLVTLLQGAEESPDGKSSSRGEGSLHRPGPHPLHGANQPQNLQAGWQEDEPLCQPDHLLSTSTAFQTGFQKWLAHHIPKQTVDAGNLFYCQITTAGDLSVLYQGLLQAGL